MPYPQFDRSRLQLLPLEDRIHDLHRDRILIRPGDPVSFSHPHLPKIAADMRAARDKGASILLMCGAHVIRAGCAPVIVDLMRRGLVTHYATNGAGAIHDFELALIGSTCESVAKYISEGQFGLWNETGLINEILQEGIAEGMGAGEAIGRYIWENNLPYREDSVLAMGYHLGIPCTVHIGVGNDIIHEHPNCDGAALGEASYTDFLVYTKTVENLENGVFLNFGSAVAGPEVYLKALAMCRNVAKQEGCQIAHFTTAVFDLLAIEGDDYHAAPPKTDPRYYFRPWKTILARTVADGGQSYYVQGEHKYTLPALAKLAIE